MAGVVVGSVAFFFCLTFLVVIKEAIEFSDKSISNSQTELQSPAESTHFWCVRGNKKKTGGVWISGSSIRHGASWSFCPCMVISLAPKRLKLEW